MTREQLAIAVSTVWVVMAAVLFYRRRQTFKRIVPVAAVLGLMFIAATWNLQGGIGLPATAI